ncbi:uncharacterized protein LOC120688703 [Panicum virgatum]|uniref:uncharacterized protein LOC120688703 n=1 Tax=Panicum virgatum TaxID=38727 RepID=UPI0019D62BA5|nr:uncharacterized protein LOC120688703 [Panicum virgatum]
MTGPDETTGREPPGAGQCGQLATGQAADSDGGTRTYSRKRRLYPRFQPKVPKPQSRLLLPRKSINQIPPAPPPLQGAEPPSAPPPQGTRRAAAAVAGDRATGAAGARATATGGPRCLWLPPSLSPVCCVPFLALAPCHASPFSTRRLPKFAARSSGGGGGSCPEPKPGDNGSKAVLDAFFLGKAFAEALTERVESVVGEVFSVVGQW